jgi:hypothetical protein
VATSRTAADVASGTAPPFALTDGFQAAFIGGAGIAVVGVLVALLIVRRRDLGEPAPAAQPVLEGA